MLIVSLALRAICSKHRQGKFGTVKSGFRGDVQGLRALAILLVLLYHSGVSVLSGGYIGVDVFFVISGFLITSHILKEVHTNGRLNFGQFYARRARRILPASFAVLGASVIAALIWLPPLRIPSMLEDAAATALYVPNILFAVRRTDYLAESAPSVFQHYWSLGIEEQFYLLWPLVLVLALYLSRKSVRALVVVLTILVVLSFGASVLMTDVSQPLAFFLLPTRAWELGIGGLIGLLLTYRPRWVSSRLFGLTGWAGLGLVVAGAFILTSESPFPGYLALVPVAGTALVLIAGSGDHAWGPARLLSVKPAIFIGGISYSLYLIHWPLLVIPQEAVGLQTPLPLWSTLLLGAAAVPLAWLSFRYIEEPARRARTLASARPRRTLFAALGVSALVAASTLIGVPIAESQPLTTSVRVQSTPPTALPQGQLFVPENLEPSLRSAAKDNPSIYENGCHRSEASSDASGCTVGDSSTSPTVVLFGDSHAAQWYPPLAQIADDGVINLESHTKSACPSAEIDDEGYRSCSEWRSGVIEKLNQSPPDVIVLSNFSEHYAYMEPADPGTYWKDSMRRTIESLPSESLILVIADTPNSRVTPAICLSAHLSDTEACNLPFESALDEPTRNAEKTVGEGWIDLNDYFCGPDDCPVIIGNVLVYRDEHHVSATFSSSLAAVLEERILGELGKLDK